MFWGFYLVFRLVDEFNVLAIAPQALQLKLAAAAIYGSEATVNAFTQAADRAGLTERGRALKEKEQERRTTAVMATQERVAEFQKKLDAIQRESYDALIKSEERLREAQKALERIRERAYEVPLPDGTKLKVYRDGDLVRDDNDNIVDASIIRAEDIPDSSPTRAERRKEQERVEERAQDHKEQSERYTKIEAAQERLRSGGLSDDDFAELEKSVEPVKRPSQKPEPGVSATPPRQDASMPAPM